MTQAIISALEDALATERTQTALADRIAAIATSLATKGETGGRDLTKAERDALWGH